MAYMDYTNKDYYDYISKIDSEYSPLHDTYTKILELLLKEGLNKPLSDASKDSLFQLLKIRKRDFKEKEIEDLEKLLYYDCAFRRVFKNDNGSFSVYPKLKELPDEEDLLMYYILALKLSVSEAVTFLNSLCSEQFDILKNGKIENYYGSHKYIISRTKAIYDAIVMLNNRSDIENKVLINSALSNVSALLNKMLNIVGLENTEETYNNLMKFDYQLPINKSQYDSIRNSYVKVLEFENMLVDISNEIWKKYAKEHNGVFIHQLTQGTVESDKMSKICTCFYSDNANFITNYFDANTGYAYPMDISRVFEVCEKDVGSWRVNQREFIERGLLENWQLDETNLWYECPYHSKLFPPEYIERKAINNNSFAEIIIDNRFEKVKPLYCFYTSNATQKQIEEITRLAESQGLEVKQLATQIDNNKGYTH